MEDYEAPKYEAGSLVPSNIASTLVCLVHTYIQAGLAVLDMYYLPAKKDLPNKCFRQKIVWRGLLRQSAKK